MISSSFSPKSPSWFKTKVLSFFSLIFLSLFLVGCGSSSGGGSSGGDNGNKSGGEYNNTSKTEQSYEKLSGYYASVKDILPRASFKQRVEYKVYYLTSNTSVDKFVQSLTGKGFTNSISDYYNVTTTSIPTVSGAEVNISKEGSYYSVRLSITSSEDKTVSDNLFDDIFGTVDANLSDSGFTVFTDNNKSDIGKANNDFLESVEFEIDSETNESLRYVQHTDHGDYYINYSYDITSQLMAMDFYFEKHLPLLFVNGQGLPSVNPFIYFPPYNGLPPFSVPSNNMTYEIQRYFKDSNDAVKYNKDVINIKGCIKNDLGSIHCPSYNKYIVDTTTGAGAPWLIHKYSATTTVIPTNKLLWDIFYTPNIPIVDIVTINKYNGDLSLQFDEYAKILVEYGFIPNFNYTKYTKEEGLNKYGQYNRKYSWSWDFDTTGNQPVSTARWYISDISYEEL
jgi:hypothetical protein